ncbi:hypothetical protein JXR01_02020 [Candidatus Kaiserbacteria bacterium]|nr:MAG: hypothetical protein JXR01_02020 [Candidatus Kaiserbacteria bacterium]
METTEDVREKAGVAFFWTMWLGTILASLGTFLYLLFIEGWASEEGWTTVLLIGCAAAPTYFTCMPLGRMIAKKTQLIGSEDAAVLVCAVMFTSLFIALQFIRPSFEVAPGHIRISDTGEVFTAGDIVVRTPFRFSSAEVDLNPAEKVRKGYALTYTVSSPVESHISVSTLVVWEPNSAQLQQIAARYATDLYSVGELPEALRVEILSPLIFRSVGTLFDAGRIDGASLKQRLGIAMNKVHDSEPAIRSIDIKTIYLSHVTVRNP